MKTLFLLFATLTLAQPIVTQIDCGSATDQYFIGGTAFADASLGAPPLNTLRFGARFSYRIPAQPGAYLVRILFIEPNATAIGRRIFTVASNGVASDPIDLFKDGGAHAQRTIESTAVSYWGFIRLDFAGVVGNAVVTRIEVYSIFGPLCYLDSTWPNARIIHASFACDPNTPADKPCGGLQYAVFRRPDGTKTWPYLIIEKPDLPIDERWIPAIIP